MSRLISFFFGLRGTVKRLPFLCYGIWTLLFLLGIRYAILTHFYLGTLGLENATVSLEKMSNIFWVITIISILFLITFTIVLAKRLRDAALNPALSLLINASLFLDLYHASAAFCVSGISCPPWMDITHFPLFVWIIGVLITIIGLLCLAIMPSKTH